MGDSQPGFAFAYSCVIAATRCLPKWGLPMTMHVHIRRADVLNQSAAERLAARYPHWAERVVTVVAASLAVLVVALIAVVMGMA